MFGIVGHTTWNLVVQQLTMRYRRAWLGFAWMILVPLATMSITALAMSLVFSVRSREIICNVFVCLLPYNLFQTTVSTASGSLVGSQDILRRHNINRIVFPLSAMFVCVVEYLTASLALIVLGPILGIHLNSTAACIPLGFVCLCAAATGLGLLGAIGTVFFRDLSQIIQVTLSLLYWLTPVVYTLQMMPEHVRGYFFINPLVSMLALYSEPLVHGRMPPAICFVIGPAVAVSLLVLGILVFRQFARRVVFYL